MKAAPEPAGPVGPVEPFAPFVPLVPFAPAVPVAPTGPVTPEEFTLQNTFAVAEKFMVMVLIGAVPEVA